MEAGTGAVGCRQKMVRADLPKADHQGGVGSRRTREGNVPRMLRVLTGEVVAEALRKPGRPGCRLALGRPESEITERPGAQTGLAKRAGAWNSERHVNFISQTMGGHRCFY